MWKLKVSSLAVMLLFAGLAQAQVTPVPTAAPAVSAGHTAKVILRVLSSVPAYGVVPVNEFFLVNDGICGSGKMKIVAVHNTKYAERCATVDHSTISGDTAKAEFFVLNGRPVDFTVPHGDVRLVSSGCGRGNFTIISGGERRTDTYRAVACVQGG